jgi:rubrerythrin
MKVATQKSLDALSNGINAELAAYVFYKHACKRVNNEELLTLLLKLADEEKNHYWTLETEYDSLVRSEKWVTYNDIMRKERFPEIPEEMAETHRQRIDKLGITSDPQKILKMAIELEEEARDFYKTQIAKVEDPAAIEIYTYLAKFEQGHVSVLTALAQRLK